MQIYVEEEENALEETSAPAVDGTQPLSISLAPTGGEGSGFHTQNDPKNPYQRSNYVERQGPVEIRCTCTDVVHGLLAADSDVFCTLLVLEFRFDPRKRARRISSVAIEMQFSSLEPNAGEPVVSAVAPSGHFDVAPSKQREKSGTSVDLKIGGGVAAGPSASAGVKWDNEVERHMTYATTVSGATALRRRNWGESNCASWSLLENSATKTGVPVAMKAAILLKRPDEEKFQCFVTINARADWRSSLESVFGSTPPDDPVLFDPTMDPTTTAYDEMNLGQVDLDSIASITFSRVVTGAS